MSATLLPFQNTNLSVRQKKNNEDEQPDVTTLTIGGKTYNYVWGDEFNGATLDASKWVYNVASTKMSGYSDLTLLSTNEAIGIGKDADNNSYLRLTALKKNENGAVSYAAPASVHTQGRMEYTYGYVEIRAKVPYQTGVWPSFWAQSNTLLGGRKCTNYYAEIDMLEVFGSEDTLFSNIHQWYKDGTHKVSRDDETFFDKWFGGDDGEDEYIFTNGDAADWHTYGMEWTGSTIKMYVDGTCFRTYNINSAYDCFGLANIATDMSGYDDPLYLIFNNHLFTEGTTLKSHAGDILEVEDFVSADYMIDYIRLYQADGSSIRTR